MNLQMADQSESRISDSIGVVTSFIFIELFTCLQQKICGNCEKKKIVKLRCVSGSDNPRDLYLYLDNFQDLNFRLHIRTNVQL